MRDGSRLHSTSERGKTNSSSQSAIQSDFSGAASLMSSQISSALDTLADLAQGFLYPFEDGEEDSPPALETSSITMDTQETATSREIRNVMSEPSSIMSDRSGVSNTSSALPPPPQILEARVGSAASSAFEPTVRRPIPVSTRGLNSSFDSIQSAPFQGVKVPPSPSHKVVQESRHYGEGGSMDSDDSSDSAQSDEILARSSPMARMRSNQIAEAIRLVPPTAISPPRPTGEEAVAQKHRKWRRQIKRAQEKRRQQQAVADLGVCTPSFLQVTDRSDPSEILQQLLRKTARCVRMDDSASFTSEYSSEEESTSSPEYDEHSPGRNTTARRPKDRDSVFRSRQTGGDEAEQNDSEDDDDDTTEEMEDGNESHQKIKRATVDIRQKGFIKHFITEASKLGLALVLHKPDKRGTEYTNPLEIMAFVEFGYKKEDGDYVGPQFAWYSADGNLLGSFDLLDIRSLEKATVLHLQDYPYTIPGHSLMLRIHSSDDPLVLEAESSDEAKRIIHGLRWIVARMTFNLIIGNRDVTAELLELRPTSDPQDSLKAMNDVTNQLVEKSVFNTAKVA